LLIKVCISIGPSGMALDPPPPVVVVVLLPQASKKALSAAPERPTAPACLRKSRRLWGANNLPNNSCSELLIWEYLHDEWVGTTIKGVHYISTKCNAIE